MREVSLSWPAIASFSGRTNAELAGRCLDEPGDGVRQFFGPAFGVVAARKFIEAQVGMRWFRAADEASDGVELAGVLAHAAGRMGYVVLRFLCADADPEAGIGRCGASELRGEPFIVPPCGGGLSKDAAERGGVPKMDR